MINRFLDYSQIVTISACDSPKHQNSIMGVRGRSRPVRGILFPYGENKKEGWAEGPDSAMALCT
jgi:hypothetical protein